MKSKKFRTGNVVLLSPCAKKDRFFFPLSSIEVSHLFFVDNTTVDLIWLCNRLDTPNGGVLLNTKKMNCTVVKNHFNNKKKREFLFYKLRLYIFFSLFFFYNKTRISMSYSCVVTTEFSFFFFFFFFLIICCILWPINICALALVEC